MSNKLQNIINDLTVDNKELIVERIYSLYQEYNLVDKFFYIDGGIIKKSTIEDVKDDIRNCVDEYDSSSYRCEDDEPEIVVLSKESVMVALLNQIKEFSYGCME